MNKQCALQERENECETGREGERGAVERRMGGGEVVAEMKEG